MNSRLKGIVTVILIVIIGLVAVSGIGYIRQRMAADQGVKYLKQKDLITAKIFYLYFAVDLKITEISKVYLPKRPACRSENGALRVSSRSRWPRRCLRRSSP